ncbi:hypothetical protein [Formosa sp. S-31]|uniref:hypothetical protein n=1 Tax=Formosa sp. S-31 TaxID=2790949 RepID=UPI003EBFF375
MKNGTLLIIALVVFSLNSIYGQDISALEKGMGFRDIKLGGYIFDYDCFVKDNAERSMMRGITGEPVHDVYRFVLNEKYPYDKIGDLSIYMLLVKVNYGQIYEIKIFLEPNNRILELLTYKYGRCTEYNKDLFPTYYWRTKNGIQLAFMGPDISGVKSYTLTYLNLNLYEQGKLAAKKSRAKAQSEREKKLRSEAQSQF